MLGTVADERPVSDAESTGAVIRTRLGWADAARATAKTKAPLSTKVAKCHEVRTGLFPFYWTRRIQNRAARHLAFLQLPRSLVPAFQPCPATTGSEMRAVVNGFTCLVSLTPLFLTRHSPLQLIGRGTVARNDAEFWLSSLPLLRDLMGRVPITTAHATENY